MGGTLEIDSSGSVQITLLYNPLDYTKRKDIFVPHRQAATISHYVSGQNVVVSKDAHLLYGLNGRRLTEEECNHLCPNPGDQIVVKAIPVGGGGGLRTILSLVVMVAAVFVTPYLAPIIAPIVGASLAPMVAMMAVSMVGALLVNAFIPVQSPQIPTFTAPQFSAPGMSTSSLGTGGGGDFGQTSTYGWGPLENMRSQGLPIPRLYGVRKIAGNIIGRSIDIVGDDQYLNILIHLGEGPFHSISNVEINGQPSSYYSDIETETMYGTLSQTAPKYHGDTFNTQTFNLEITTGTYITKQTIGNTAEGLRIEVNCPSGLYYINDDGSLSSTSVTFSIDYKLTSAGDWASYTSQTITGATQSAIRRAYDIRDLAAGQYDVRVKKTAGSTGTRYSTGLYLIGIGEIIPDDFSYPMSPMVSIRVKGTSQLSNTQPAITSISERTYVPVHNGSSWVAKRADNPAWAAYDVLVRPSYYCNSSGSDLVVYSVDGVAYTRMIYADFLAWADYCDLKGFTFNAIFDSQMKIWDALAQIAQVGRGQVVMKGTKISCVVDKPMAASQMFTVGSIGQDSFSMDYLSLESRANCLEVTYFDASRDYQRETFTIYGNGYAAGDEIRKTQLTLYGCTSYNQAYKEADFRLKCNFYLPRTITFQADVDSIACQVGEVIKIQHDIPQWGYGGRIKRVYGAKVQLDQSVTLASGTTYSLALRQQDDTLRLYTVSNLAGTTDVISVSGGFLSTPNQYEPFAIGVENQETKQFKIIKLSRGQDLKRQITAIEYNSSMYTDGTPVTLNESALTVYPVAIRMTVKENLVGGPGGTWVSQVYVSWQRDSSSAEGWWKIYRKDLSVSGSTWEHIADTDELTHISNADWIYLHQYQVAVVGVARLTGKSDNPATATSKNLTILWKYGPPEDVTGFAATQDGEYIVFSWNHIADADRRGYEIREGPSWSGGTSIVKEVSSNKYRHPASYDGTYTYSIKAIDTSGNYSTNATSVTITVVGITSLINVIYKGREIDDFINGIASGSGLTSNLIFVGSGNTKGLHVPHSLTDSSVTPWVDSGTSLTAYTGTTSLTGYYRSPIRDVGAAALSTLRISHTWESSILKFLDTTYPNRTDQSYPKDTDTDITDESILQTLYRASESSPLSSLSWVTYTSPVQSTFRYYQLKEAFALDSAHTQLAYTSINAFVDVPETTMVFTSKDVGGSGTTFNLSSDFGITMFVRYAVSCSVITNPYFYMIKNKTLTSFFVTLFDDAGAKQAGLVDITLKGF